MVMSYYGNCSHQGWTRPQTLSLGVGPQTPGTKIYYDNYDTTNIERNGIGEGAGSIPTAPTCGFSQIFVYRFLWL